MHCRVYNHMTLLVQAETDQAFATGMEKHIKTSKMGKHIKTSKTHVGGCVQIKLSLCHL